MISLSEKEIFQLKDAKRNEELCIKKYTRYSQQATDPQLRNLFSHLGQKEQEHLQTVEGLLAGQLPTMGQNKTPEPIITNGSYNASDAEMCEDMLSSEKYVASSYNTAVFEFSQPQLRTILNHIQTEEQQHGEKLYQYMSLHEMYQA